MDTSRPLQTGKYDMCVIDGGHAGAFAVESEPGRSIVFSRGQMATDAKGEQHYVSQARVSLDARDIPRLLNALSWARDNATLPAACPNGCNSDEGTACSECP